MGFRAAHRIICHIVTLRNNVDMNLVRIRNKCIWAPINFTYIDIYVGFLYFLYEHSRICIRGRLLYRSSRATLAQLGVPGVGLSSQKTPEVHAGVP